MSNPDDLPPSRIVYLALTDYDDTGQPAVRAFVNILATKITSLTHTEILRLSDEKIGRLIETEFSRLSDDEIGSLLDASLLVAEASGFFDSIGDMILKILAAGVTDIVKSNPIPFMIFGCALCIQSGIFCILICLRIKEIIYETVTLIQQMQHTWSKWRSPKQAVIVPTNTAQDQPRPSRRPNFVPYSRDLEMLFSVQGLNCNGEIYSRGTNMQAEQH